MNRKCSNYLYYEHNSDHAQAPFTSPTAAFPTNVQPRRTRERTELVLLDFKTVPHSKQ